MEDFAMTGQHYGRHLRIVLEEAAPVSWNTLYKQDHWSKRTEQVDAVRLEVMAALHELAVFPDTFLRPVHITITAYKRNRPIDADNVAAKLYIDALKACGLLVDDNPHWLYGVTTISRADAANPRIEIDVMEVA